MSQDELEKRLIEHLQGTFTQKVKITKQDINYCVTLIQDFTSMRKDKAKHFLAERVFPQLSFFSEEFIGVKYSLQEDEISITSAMDGLSFNVLIENLVPFGTELVKLGHSLEAIRRAKFE